MAFSPALFLLGVPTTVTGFIDGGNTPIVFTSDDLIDVTSPDTAVVTVTTTGGTGAVAFSVVSGEDASGFTVDPDTGDLAFLSASQFGVYEVVVRASNDWGSGEQAIVVEVGSSATIDVTAPETEVTTVVAGGVFLSTYTKSGDDEALFTLDPDTGVLAFVDPSAAGSYDVTVTATNDLGAADLDLTIVVAAGPSGDWLLSGGTWQDSGVWDDTAVWEDS